MRSQNQYTPSSGPSDITSCLIVEAFDAEGRLIERWVGPSSSQLKVAHERGECSAMCSHCHQAVADALEEDAALRAMYERVVGRPASWV